MFEKYRKSREDGKEQFTPESFAPAELPLIQELYNWYVKAKENGETIPSLIKIAVSKEEREKEFTSNIFYVFRGAHELRYGKYYPTAKRFGKELERLYSKRDMDALGELLAKATGTKSSNPENCPLLEQQMASA